LEPLIAAILNEILNIYTGLLDFAKTVVQIAQAAFSFIGNVMETVTKAIVTGLDEIVAIYELKWIFGFGIRYYVCL
jgi:hypothetical protein